MKGSGKMEGQTSFDKIFAVSNLWWKVEQQSCTMCVCVCVCTIVWSKLRLPDPSSVYSTLFYVEVNSINLYTVWLAKNTLFARYSSSFNWKDEQNKKDKTCLKLAKKCLDQHPNAGGNTQQIVYKLYYRKQAGMAFAFLFSLILKLLWASFYRKS